MVQVERVQRQHRVTRCVHADSCLRGIPYQLTLGVPWNIFLAPIGSPLFQLFVQNIFPIIFYQNIPISSIRITFFKIQIQIWNPNSNPNPNETEPPLIKKLTTLVQELVDVPLCIDSSVPAALEAGLVVTLGRPLLNSVTGEEERLVAVPQSAREQPGRWPPARL